MAVTIDYKSPHIKRFSVVALAVLFVAGLALRLYHLGEQSLWIDEGYSINAAQAVLKKGLPLLDSNEMYGRGLAQTYAMAISMALFGFDPEDPWSARVPSATLGAVSIVGIFLLAKRLFESYSVALASSIFIALSTWEIAWGRQARGYAGMQLFLILAIYFFYLWFCKRNYRDLIFGFLFIGVSILFHPVAAVALVPLFILLFVDQFVGKINKKALITCSLLLLLAIGAFSAVPLMPFNLQFDPFLINFMFWSYPLLLVSSVMSLFLAVLSSTKRKEIYGLGFTAFTAMLMLSTYWYSLEKRYLLVVFPIITILASYFIVSACGHIFKRARVVSGLSLLIFVIVFSSNLMIFPREEFDLQGPPQPNFKEAYRYVNTYRKNNDVILSSYTHLNKIYTGDPGYWLMIEFIGRSTEFSRSSLVRGTDYYTGAPLIDNGEDIERIMRANSGFVVIDTMAGIRLGKEKMSIIESLSSRIGYQSGSKGNKILVYEF